MVRFVSRIQFNTMQNNKTPCLCKHNNGNTCLNNNLIQWKTKKTVFANVTMEMVISRIQFNPTQDNQTMEFLVSRIQFNPMQDNKTPYLCKRSSGIAGQTGSSIYLPAT